MIIHTYDVHMWTFFPLRCVVNGILQIEDIFARHIQFTRHIHKTYNWDTKSVKMKTYWQDIYFKLKTYSQDIFGTQDIFARHIIEIPKTWNWRHIDKTYSKTWRHIQKTYLAFYSRHIIEDIHKTYSVAKTYNWIDPGFPAKWSSWRQ